jgi:hypothetical protein
VRYRQINWMVCGLLITVIVLSAVSCSKWEVKEVDYENYRPEIAFPLGEFNISVMDFVNGIGFPAVDPGQVPQGTPLIWYNNAYYATHAERFDTTLAIDFTLEIEDKWYDYIKSVMFRSNFINYSDASVYGQVYFLRSGEQAPFDSLFQQGPLLIHAGTVKSDGTIQEVESLKNDVYLDEQQIEQFRDISTIDIALSFRYDPVPGQVTRYPSDLFMWVQGASRIAFDVDVNQLQ